MEHPRLRALSSCWRLILGLLLGVLAVTTAGAQGTARSFVQDPYYLGNESGVPPSLLEFSADPSAYLRSDAAYTALRLRFAEVLGRDSLSETEFAAVFTTGSARLRDCEGRIRTAGILPSGSVVWTTRACYPGERLIEVLVGDEWRVAASQGCFNPVRVIVPPPEPPGREVCGLVPESGMVVDTIPDVHLGSVYHPGCNCYRKPQFTPSLHIDNDSSASTGGWFRVCEWVSD